MNIPMAQKRVEAFYNHFREIAKHRDDMYEAWEELIKKGGHRGDSTVVLYVGEVYTAYVRIMGHDELSDSMIPLVAVYTLVSKRFNIRPNIADMETYLPTMIEEALEGMYQTERKDRPINPAIMHKRIEKNQ